MKTNRRWLQSAISASATQDLGLPWAKDRDVKTAQVITWTMAQNPAHSAIAAA